MEKITDFACERCEGLQLQEGAALEVAGGMLLGLVDAAVGAADDFARLEMLEG